MRKFMLPFDGSENALRAAHYAVSLVRDESPAQVYLVTVNPDPVVYCEAALYLDLRKLQVLQRKQSEQLLKPAEELLSRAGVTYQEEILTGDVAPTIVRRAEDLGCDVIVMGTRGMGALTSLIMGSTAMKVVHLTKLPVTLIK
jgi:nucleotide-binding universal stress UspA family protein